MTRLDDVLSRLDQVRRTRRGWSARCPAHRDRYPSLSIAQGLDGRVLFRCFAGCTYQEITRALDIETTTAPATAHTPPSTLALALAIARRQPWYREETRLTYFIADSIRRRRRAVDVARAIATRAGDRRESWSLLAAAALVERDAHRIEAELEDILW